MPASKPKRERKLLTKAGDLKCPKCRKVTTPQLVERGYSVTHDLVGIKDNRVEARGWDGDSSDMSEGGDSFWLACRSCWHEVPMPAGVEIDWL